ncbi:MAG: hypothetical protein JXN61_07070 [Sedimentisphaerales bacterium]|nr:hypothetical protein [Sedimentisphaerales bacterium]
MADKSFKVSLPGSLYQKNNRWWWKVKLPGETRIKARGLKSEGAQFATTQLEEAEELARVMWESAIRSEVEAEARAKAGEKAKSAAAEMAAVKAEAEETVARLKSGIMETVANAKDQCEAKIRQCHQMVAKADERVRAEVEKRAAIEAKYEEELRQYKEALAQADERLKAEAEARIQAEAKLQEFVGGVKPTAQCECCGKDGVPEEELTTIDSGQRLCPDCLAVLRG